MEGPPVSIDEQSLAAKIAIYPNPTAGHIFVDFGTKHEDIRITIRDLLGKEISTIPLRHTASASIEISQPKGVYLLEIRVPGNEPIISKVIKQ